MDGSDAIYIVLPIVAIVILAILVGLPFFANRGEGRSPSGGQPSLGHRAQDQVQVPSRSAPADASDSDAIGPGNP
jgi:hypothetical protein